MERLLITAIIFIATIKGPARCLSNLRVSVPSVIMRGENVNFSCNWDQDPVDRIWAVKWYRGNIEIFRFIKDETPPTKVFPLDHFDVDGLLSDGRNLWLRKVNLHNSGKYSCEVITDHTFHTLEKSAHMQVVDLPDEKPRITGTKDKYRLGEQLEAMCTSWQSHPPANLTWFINEEPARQEYLRPQKIREEYDDTFTSVLGLRFEIGSHHFQSGSITLKCTSSLLTIYWQSTTIELREASPRWSPVMESGGGTGDSVTPKNNPVKNNPDKQPHQDVMEVDHLPRPVASNLPQKLMANKLVICFVLAYVRKGSIFIV